ncbi:MULTISPECIES: flagellar basal body P-ring formation chaperone FlgA [Massilia]|jgi:flagella basal body P-ring formation protein FlgA|uniref:Flagella basal body P-ring formation protein FlgA n=2 Tax=Massilia TaxID=149698 RepID=A0A7X3KA61_9BURK|nr:MULTISPECIES: flagellar basal body P-ring formation chaperone FlgA [Telluria group]KQX96716.1 flagellar biosynthesis protein FlgA [Massilia sp. Root133]KQZ52427.1 flagellar biosynthesis protein FlgA [Massilia sp. Root1485]MDN4043638.1 flagellar basal body P-ring formation chaperone FlgA [Massilia sp. YIM B02787]MVW63065.1 flagellar basal body P-ring formation protein FlgA [Telluria cellulosilytica]
MKRTLITALLIGAAALAHAQTTPAGGRQNVNTLRTVVEQFLRTQTAGLPGTVTVKVGAIDARTALAACPAPEAFLQPGARAWGKTTVGVRCTAPSNWTLFVQAQVNVQADYVAAALPLAQGQPIEQSQLVLMKGDIAAMPNGIITDMAQAIGRTPTVSLVAGTPLRLDTLRSRPVVQQGQAVRLVTSGNGFSVSAEGKAIGNASDGQIVQVRTPSGSVVSGTARSGGMVEVAF